MGNAHWLFFALPEWYFASIFQPFGAGPLTLIPSIGIISLAVGIVWGALKRRAGLFIFLVLPLGSQFLVAVAGWMRGEVPAPGTWLWAFIILEFALAAFFIFRMTSARAPALALSVFAMSYASFATFVAAMSFTDSWL